MRKEIFALIEEYSRNFPDYNGQRLLRKKIFFETSFVEKKEIVHFCQQEIKKLRFDFFVRILLVILLVLFWLGLGKIFQFKVTIMTIYLFLFIGASLSILVKTEIIYLIITKIALIFLGRKKIFIYENLLTLKESLSLDDYYAPFGCCSCIYYHGETYNGNQLICPIHPYGLKDCPDFEEAKTTETDICE